MKISYDLRDEWVNVKIPIRIREALSNIPSDTGRSAVWRSIDFLLKQNERFLSLRKSPDYNEILNKGRMIESNIFMKMMEEIEQTQKKILEKLEKNKPQGG